MKTILSIPALRARVQRATGLWRQMRFWGSICADELERWLPFSRRPRGAKSGVFCMLPWVHMNVAQEGKAYPCCMASYARHDLPVADLKESSLESAWNSAGMKRIRRNMLDGRPSPECAGCHELERSGVRSLRQQSNKVFAGHFPRVLETRDDGDSGPLRMPYMDIRFSNVCNFRCRTCGPGSSSSLQAEAAQLAGASIPKLLTPTRNPADLWRQIEPLLPDLEKIYFAGGEPLLMEEHYRILEFLISRRMFKVRLSYNTNFSVLDYAGRHVLPLWSRFEKVTVRASLDGMGGRGEYLRKGQDWARVVVNRKRMMRECPGASFWLAPTMSAMNVLHLPDFHREWVSEGLVACENMDVNLLLNPAEFSIQALPERIKRKVLERYEAHMADFIRPSGWRARPLLTQLQGAMRHMMAQDRSSELDAFRTRIMQLDEARGETFAAIFPELSELVRPE